jgi:hypothetical protein
VCSNAFASFLRRALFFAVPFSGFSEKSTHDHLPRQAQDLYKEILDEKAEEKGATRTGHPELMSWKYPLPTDSVVSMCHRVIIDVAAASVVRLQMPPDYHRATLGDDIRCDAQKWSPSFWGASPGLSRACLGKMIVF